MFQRIQKRQFWTIYKGNMVGYIEGMGNTGILFKNNEITFRQTSSNLANGQEWRMSIEKISESDIKPLTQFIQMKIPKKI